MEPTSPATTPVPIGQLQLTPDQQKAAKAAKLHKAAQEFEAYFVQQMFTQMRKAVPQDGMMHSKGEDMFRDLLDQQVGEDIAKGKGIGLSDSLYRQLSLQEGHSGQ